MLDDHDMIDGFGSYPDDLQTSPVFSAFVSFPVLQRPRANILG